MRCLTIAKPIRPTPITPTCSMLWSSLPSDVAAIDLGCRVFRDITLANILQHGLASALRRITVAAPAGRLQQKSLAGLHFVTAGSASLAFLVGAELDHEPRAAARLAAIQSLRREFCLVEATDDGRIFQQLIFAQQAQTSSPAPGAAGIGH